MRYINLHLTLTLTLTRRTDGRTDDRQTDGVLHLMRPPKGRPYNKQIYTQYLSTLRFNHIRPKILSTLTFRLPPEVFIRRMKSSFLHPVFGTVSNRCAKKTVVRMTELVAALLPVHGYLLCQEPDEEMMTSFFWWRLPVEVETSR